MHQLSAQELLHIWEIGKTQHPIDRALMILGTVFPEESQEELASLSIGQRDTRLLHIREQLFRSKLAAVADCPKCNEQLEFSLDAAKLIQASPMNAPPATEHHLSADGFELDYHPPNSLDLATIVNNDDGMDGRQLLIEHCVTEIHRDGEKISPADLPEEIISLVADRIQENDPQAEMQIELSCPACCHQWQLLFDIVPYFWQEICAEAKRLLREVHILARSYGWREADILNMSAARRQIYLEMVTE